MSSAGQSLHPRIPHLSSTRPAPLPVSDLALGAELSVGAKYCLTLGTSRTQYKCSLNRFLFLALPVGWWILVQQEASGEDKAGHPREDGRT